MVQWLIEPDSPNVVFRFPAYLRQAAVPADVPDRTWVVIEASTLEEEVRRTYRHISAYGYAHTFLQGAIVIRDSVVNAIEATITRHPGAESFIATPAKGFILTIPIDGNSISFATFLPCSLERVQHTGDGVPAAAFDSISDAVLYLVIRHQYLPLEFDPV